MTTVTVQFPALLRLHWASLHQALAADGGQMVQHISVSHLLTSSKAWSHETPRFTKHTSSAQHNCPSVCFWLYACDVSRYVVMSLNQSDGPNPCIGHWTLNICFHFMIMHQASQYFFLTITPIKWFSPSLFINWSICTPYNQINILEKIIFRSEAIIYQRHDQLSDFLDLCRLF